MSECLDDLRHKALALQEITQGIADSTVKVLGDHSRLWWTSVQLTKAAKNHNLHVIVCGHIAAMIGLLNINTDVNLKYSWRRAAEIVAKMQGHGTNLAQCIRKWTLAFLKWGDLPLCHLDQKQGTIIDDKDVAQEIMTCIAKKAKVGFLKAQDVMEVVASPQM